MTCGVTIPSPLMLLDGLELSFYRSRSLALCALRGTPVAIDNIPAGALRDVTAAGGELLDVLVESGDQVVRRIPFRDSLTLVPVSRTAA